MSTDTLEQFIRSYIAASPGPEVSFVWHGGEPTLAGLDFYRNAVELQKYYLPEGWVCWNNLQTNGVLLDDEWCEFLSSNKFDVGLSIDGTKWIHDQYRPYSGQTSKTKSQDQVDLVAGATGQSLTEPSGAGSYQAAEAAIRRLKAHGVHPDLLCTVTSTTAQEPLAVYRNLRSFGTGWIQFIPIVALDEHGQPTPESVSDNAYGEFLCAVFDEWLLHDLGRCDVQLFAETIRVLAGGEAGLCWMAPTCGRALVVEADGGVYSCDHYVTPEHRLGSIAAKPEDTLRTLANSAEQRRFGDSKRTSLPAQCLSCRWLALCNGGCPKDRLAPEETAESTSVSSVKVCSGHHGVSPAERETLPDSGSQAASAGVNRLCSGLSRFFAHAVPQLEQVIALTKRRMSPVAIMKHFQEQATVTWDGVGRNDPCPCGSGKKAKTCCWEKRPNR